MRAGRFLFLYLKLVMIIEKIIIKNLRNHSYTEGSFYSGNNFIFGENGAGKTTILEAISLAALSKSFVQNADQSLIKNGEQGYSIAINSRSDSGSAYMINIIYEPGKRKKIKNTFGDNLLPKDIIGIIPCVVLSPDDKSITGGAPSERRSFVDRIISQLSKKYLEDLIHLKNVLKQRNSVLSNYHESPNDDLLDLWTDKLINIARDIIFKRASFTVDFADYFTKEYELVAENKETAEFAYLPDSNDKIYVRDSLSKEEISNLLKKRLDKLYKIEKIRGISLFGPQKDDFSIRINGGTAKEYASQGQHKSLLVSLKFAEYKYLKNLKNENPVILLDDIFSELDEHRALNVFKIIEQLNAQSFVTITELERIKPLHALKRFKTLEINEGTIQREFFKEL